MIGIKILRWGIYDTFKHCMVYSNGNIYSIGGGLRYGFM